MVFYLQRIFTESKTSICKGILLQRYHVYPNWNLLQIFVFVGIKILLHLDDFHLDLPALCPFIDCEFICAWYSAFSSVLVIATVDYDFKVGCVLLLHHVLSDSKSR